MSDSHLQDAIREKYGEIARTVGKTGCCGANTCDGGDPITSGLYSSDETAGVPADALAASLGCGNPAALVDLQPGQVVLDLGSGGGIDVLLSAKRVGSNGKVYGLDMTDEMLALARENQRKADVTNVEFLKGTMEAIPLPDGAVDVVISNCVINLSLDKDAVLREAFRVLKPNGIFAVSDVVVRGEMPPQIKRSMELWCGCIAGALRDDEYLSKLQAAGFADAEVSPWRFYQSSDARAFLTEAGLDVGAIAPQIDGKLASAFIRARKPQTQACCGPTCCS